MSSHKARTWDHRENKPLDLKFLLLDHHLDNYYKTLIRLLLQSCNFNFLGSVKNHYEVYDPMYYYLF